MAVGSFKPQFTLDELRAVLREKTEIIKTALVNEMQYAGELGVSTARDPAQGTRNYTDRTSNLRKSIGYLVMDKNNQLVNNFPPDDATTTGAAIGNNKAREIAAKFPAGLTFVMTAGMIYGPWVEAKGYVVLSGAARVAEQSIKKQFKRIVAMVNRKRK